MAFMHTDRTTFCTYLPHTLFLLHPPALLISKQPIATLPSPFAQVLFCLISGVGHFCLSWMHVSFCLFHLLFQFCWVFFCLFISFLLWMSTIVRQKLAERKIRNSNSKERKVEERVRHLKTWPFIQQHPVICCFFVILESCHWSFNAILH